MVLILTALGAGGYYIYKGVFGQGAVINFAATSGSLAAGSGEATTAPISVSTPVTPDAGNGNYQYVNKAFHFSLLFPKNLVAKEYQEQNSAMTASFQDPTTNQGFEVYATPYTGTQIDATRFKLDEPSGTFLQPVDVVVGGARATMFFGKNGVMGDTREVWFIRGGFLYEVTTYKQLDSWLAGIMQRWQFI